MRYPYVRYKSTPRGATLRHTARHDRDQAALSTGPSNTLAYEGRREYHGVPDRAMPHKPYSVYPALPCSTCRVARVRPLEPERALLVSGQFRGTV